MQPRIHRNLLESSLLIQIKLKVIFLIKSYPLKHQVNQSNLRHSSRGFLLFIVFVWMMAPIQGLFKGKLVPSPDYNPKYSAVLLYNIAWRARSYCNARLSSFLANLSKFITRFSSDNWVVYSSIFFLCPISSAKLFLSTGCLEMQFKVSFCILFGYRL